jgi:uncharacterized integral membrane protein
MIRAIVLFLGLGLLGVFALINWPAFTTPQPLDLVFTTVSAPLGAILLGVTVFMALLFTVWAISMQTASLSESRRLSKDLQAQRELADKAEASRFVELRSFFSSELSRVAQATYETRSDLQERIDRLHSETRTRLDEHANSVAASIGEFEDRIEHQYMGDGVDLRQRHALQRERERELETLR